MVFVLLGLATVLTVIWFVLLGMVADEDWSIAAYNKVLENREQVKKIKVKDAGKQEQLAQYHGLSRTVMSLFLGGGSSKEIAKLERANEALQRGNLKRVNIFAMPGYVLQRKFDAIGKGGIHKNILTKSNELYGKKNAANKTKQIVAGLLSYPIIGVSLSLAIGGICIGGGQTTLGLAIVSAGTALILILAYAIYDDVSDKVNKRRSAISRQFPNVVSKLALLVTSGMIISRAWNETARSQDLELYQEMQRTSDELDNLVSPETAYGNFITRCNTKETAKLASAILQGMSKDTSEIGRLLQNMAREAWLERRHTAKRDSEKANAKLMIPTMLLFISILAMIMVPIAMTFSGVGF
jgi:tight adherence protein C